jgi:hypothetical protein
VAIGPKPEQHQIELRQRRSEKLPQVPFRLPRRSCGILLASQAMHVGWRNRHMRQQRFVGHAVIAVDVLRRDATLVSKENVNAIPGKPVRSTLFLSSESTVDRFGSGATR